MTTWSLSLLLLSALSFFTAWAVLCWAVVWDDRRLGAVLEWLDVWVFGELRWWMRGRM